MIPPRSVLFVPASRPRMLARMTSLGADAVIVDLEDGVAPTEKAAARSAITAAAQRGELQRLPAWMIRINAPGSSEHSADLALAETLRPSRVVVPKAEDPSAVFRIAERLQDSGCAVALMIETARGVGRARDLAGCHSRVESLILGSADLRLSMGARPDPGRAWERHAMGEILLAARMHGCEAVDGVFFRFRDLEGLARHATIARDMGYDGKSCIHPDQIPPVHEVYRSDAEEIAWAQRVLAAWSEQGGEHRGIVIADGEMIEALHVSLAERILARA